jgi:hypothetical protein
VTLPVPAGGPFVPLAHVTSVVVLKTITLVLGAMITYFAAKAYQRTGSRPLWLLAVGFAIVTAGSLLAGVVDLGLELGGTWAILTESAMTALGFAVIVYSLYAR